MDDVIIFQTKPLPKPLADLRNTHCCAVSWALILCLRSFSWLWTSDVDLDLPMPCMDFFFNLIVFCCFNVGACFALPLHVPWCDCWHHAGSQEARTDAVAWFWPSRCARSKPAWRSSALRSTTCLASRGEWRKMWLRSHSPLRTPWCLHT